MYGRQNKTVWFKAGDFLAVYAEDDEMFWLCRCHDDVLVNQESWSVFWLERVDTQNRIYQEIAESDEIIQDSVICRITLEGLSEGSWQMPRDTRCHIMSELKSQLDDPELGDRKAQAQLSRKRSNSPTLDDETQAKRSRSEYRKRRIPSISSTTTTSSTPLSHPSLSPSTSPSTPNRNTNNNHTHNSNTHTLTFSNALFPGHVTSGSYAQGVGVFTCLAGPSKNASYSGEFSGPVAYGKGKLIYANGDVFEGDFRNGKKHGQGTYTYASGTKYCGGYENDLRSGHGICTFPNGSVYDGEYVGGKRQGWGIMTHAQGDIYEGEFYDDLKHGYGTYTHKDSGDMYTGMYEKGQRHGQGKIMSNESSEEFVGQFRNGKKDGVGTVVYSNGVMNQGVWVMGVLQQYQLYAS